MPLQCVHGSGARSRPERCDERASKFDKGPGNAGTAPQRPLNRNRTEQTHPASQATGNPRHTPQARACTVNAASLVTGATRRGPLQAYGHTLCGGSRLACASRAAQPTQRTPEAPLSGRAPGGPATRGHRATRTWARKASSVCPVSWR